jgi:hypothetical protein
VTIKRPNSTPDRLDATKLTLGLVEVCEEAAPAKVEPLLLRRLLTPLPVTTRAHALEVIRLYRLRWRIEEVFRILKSNGLKIEDRQLETADRLISPRPGSRGSTHHPARRCSRRQYQTGHGCNRGR